LGKDAKHGSSSACQKKGSTDAGRAKEAFTADESSLGGKKESRRNEKGLSEEKRHTYTCGPKETLRPDEGALGSEKKSRRKIATAIEPSSCWCDIEGPLGGQSNCSREESNLHGFPHTVLSRTRLPVPPREQKQRGLTMRAWQCACKVKTGEIAGLIQLDRFLRARTSN
jgi:hypothetical protein